MSVQSKEDAAWLAHCRAERQRINELIRQMVEDEDRKKESQAVRPQR
jgi:hypothetical protein